MKTKLKLQTRVVNKIRQRIVRTAVVAGCLGLIVFIGTFLVNNLGNVRDGKAESNEISNVIASTGTTIISFSGGSWNSKSIWTSIDLPGTISTTIGSKNVVGVNTTFDTDFNVGDIILKNNNIVIGTVSAIYSATSLQLSSSANITLTSLMYKIRRVPLAEDNVVIADGHNVSINSTTSINNLTIGQAGSATLSYQSGDLSVNNIINNSGSVIDFSGCNSIKEAMVVNGDFLNNGQFDFGPNSNDDGRLSFYGNKFTNNGIITGRINDNSTQLNFYSINKTMEISGNTIGVDVTFNGDNSNVQNDIFKLTSDITISGYATGLDKAIIDMNEYNLTLNGKDASGASFGTYYKNNNDWMIINDHSVLTTANDFRVSGGLVLGDSAKLIVNKNLFINRSNKIGQELITCIGHPEITVFGSITKSSTAQFIPDNSTIVMKSSGNINLTNANNLTIDAGIGKIVSLQNNMAVNGLLNMVNGNFNIGTNTITTAKTSGGNTNSYVLTSSAYNASPIGYLKVLGVDTGVVTFPIGTSSGYTPCFISNNNGPTDYSVRVFDGVLNKGLSGGFLSAIEVEKVIKKTWEIIPFAAASACIRLQWNLSDEGTYFATNRNTAFLSKNQHTINDNSWIAQNSLPITDLYNGSFQVVASNINSFSVFGIGAESSVMPVALLNFEAKQEGTGIKVAWATASEQNNDFFTIERSNDGYLFESIARIIGAGNSNTELNYDYLDNSIESLGSIDAIYYRLKQTDFNGDYSYSKIVAMKLASANPEFEILSAGPNPFKENINLHYISDNTLAGEIIMYDLQSRVVLIKKIEIQKGTNFLTVKDLGKLPKGTYFLTFSADNKISKSVKLIKE